MYDKEPKQFEVTILRGVDIVYAHQRFKVRDEEEKKKFYDKLKQVT